MTKKPRSPGEVELGKARVVARLGIARADVQRAQQICELALASEADRREPMRWALEDAAVVNYGRPFMSNDTVGALPAKWHRFGDAVLDQAHRDILTLRNMVVAHAELEFRPITLHPAGSVLPSGLLTPRGVIGIGRPALENQSLELLARLCGDLHPRLDSAFDAAFVDLFPAGYVGPPFRFMLPSKPGRRSRR